jgi:hypothetical protein
MSEPVPLIRCTMPKPCGHCWYCLKHARTFPAVLWQASAYADCLYPGRASARAMRAVTDVWARLDALHPSRDTVIDLGK